MIRPLTAKDMGSFRGIYIACFKENVAAEGKIVSRLENALSDKEILKSLTCEYPFFVCEREGKVMGIGGLNGNEIENLYVHPNFQGTGVGKEILSFLENLARKTGHTELTVRADSPAVKFYGKFGYEAVGPCDFDFPEHGIRIKATMMKKRL